MKTIIRLKKLVLCLCLVAGCTLAWSSPVWLKPGDPAAAELLQNALQRYSEIQKNGGWQKITLTKKLYKKGEAAPFILSIKKRLQLSGDLSPEDTSRLFTDDLEAAVKMAQRRFGLPENGTVDAALVQALNVPVEKRIRQLQASLERLRTPVAEPQGMFIVVNIPEYKLHVYNESRHVFDMKVVVGKKSSPTAIFNAHLTQLVFSPYWNVPPSIVQNEILPAMKRRRNYLSANRYEITGYENGLPVIRQKPGKNNALGGVKFLFPNDHAIYFHDTPVKSLFNQRHRAYSHGCIRLEEPARLAAYLLKDDPEWTPEKIEKAMQAGSEQWVKLDQSVPVFITYFTAWIDHEGVLNFRDDVYGYDERGEGVVSSEW